MVTRLGPEERFDVKDGPRNITFVGWLLAEADSRPAGEQPPRWTELSLFKTVGGQYLLEKVGRSDVFHNESCPVEPGKPRRGRRWNSLVDALPDDDDADEYAAPEDYFIPCATCTPNFDDSPVWVEKDIYSASTFGTPEEVLTTLERPDTRNTNNRYLSRVARALLDQAIQKDQPLRDVLSAPVQVD